MSEKTPKSDGRSKGTPCPVCGLVAEGIRCPRCNALKLTSCSGACSSCRSREGCAPR
jgi:hypothetical protein